MFWLWVVACGGSLADRCNDADAYLETWDDNSPVFEQHDYDCPEMWQNPEIEYDADADRYCADYLDARDRINDECLADCEHEPGYGTWECP